jgi:O-6-methylguanine DNA methyltransferase
MESEEGRISRISFVTSCVKEEALDEVLTKAKKQIIEYLQGKRKEFSISCIPDHEGFDAKVYREVEKIPYGKTLTYSDVAGSLGNRKLARAVGNALNRNRLPIVIPCHRVVSAQKGGGGYNGGMDTKKRLLEIEENNR